MSHYLPGDVVVRRKGLVQHKGVVLADGRILHNTPRRGEHVSDAEAFSAGRRLRVERRAPHHRQRALHHAGALQTRRYNLFTNNCEHTVNRLTTGRAASPQLVGWLAGAGVATVAFALTRHPAVAAAGYALGRKLARRWRR